MMLSNINWLGWQAHFEQFLEQTMHHDAAHDREHIRRVVANARTLAVLETADMAIVLPAAWLHDCVTVPKDSPDRARASTLAAHTAGRFLRSISYPADVAPIEHAIAAHSFSANIPPRTVEAAVVRDADRLDALGAIGLARALMLGGAMQQRLYDPAAPFPETRPADDRVSVIDHFYTKLLLLADAMLTDAGRAEAQRRTAFLQQFLAQLRTELEDAPPA